MTEKDVIKPVFTEITGLTLSKLFPTKEFNSVQIQAIIDGESEWFIKLYGSLTKNNIVELYNVSGSLMELTVESSRLYNLVGIPNFIKFEAIRNSGVGKLTLYMNPINL